MINFLLSCQCALVGTKSWLRRMSGLKRSLKSEMKIRRRRLRDFCKTHPFKQISTSNKREEHWTTALWRVTSETIRNRSSESTISKERPSLKLEYRRAQGARELEFDLVRLCQRSGELKVPWISTWESARIKNRIGSKPRSRKALIKMNRWTWLKRPIRWAPIFQMTVRVDREGFGTERIEHLLMDIEVAWRAL